MSFLCELAAHNFHMCANTHTLGISQPGVLSLRCQPTLHSLPRLPPSGPDRRSETAGAPSIIPSLSPRQLKCCTGLSYIVTFKMQGGPWNINPATPPFQTACRAVLSITRINTRPALDEWRLSPSAYVININLSEAQTRPVTMPSL